MMIRLISVFLGGWLFAFSAPLLADSPMQDNLQHHQMLWRDRKVDNYQFTLQIRCFCPPPANLPLNVVVKEGKITVITDSQTQQPLTQPLHPEAKTIDQLFDVIQQAIQQKVDSLEVSYDSQWGYPTQIIIDPQKILADDETAYFISNFKPI